MRKLLFLTLLCLLVIQSVATAQRTNQTRLAAIADPNPVQTQPVKGNEPQVSETSGAKGNVAPVKGELSHPRNHVFLVGVTLYPMAKQSTDRLVVANFSDLSFCVRDMECLKSALIESRFCRDEDVQMLVSGAGNENEPTEENVSAAFDALLKKIQPGDRVLVAFSGHGISLPLEGNANRSEDYLCCADADVVYNSSIGRFARKDGIIPRKELEEALDQSAAGVKLVFIDACRNVLTGMSGISKSGEKSVGITIPKGIKGVGEFGNGVESVLTKGLYRLSSCRPGEVSHEYSGDLMNGVFTHFLIKGMLGEACRDQQSGKVMLGDLEGYVYTQTQKFIAEHVSTPDKPVSQTPRLVALPQEGNLPPASQVVFSFCSYTKPEPEPEPQPVVPGPLLTPEQMEALRLWLASQPGVGMAPQPSPVSDFATLTPSAPIPQPVPESLPFDPSERISENADAINALDRLLTFSNPQLKQQVLELRRSNQALQKNYSEQADKKLGQQIEDLQQRIQNFVSAEKEREQNESEERARQEAARQEALKKEREGAIAQNGRELDRLAKLLDGLQNREPQAKQRLSQQITALRSENRKLQDSYSSGVNDTLRGKVVALETQIKALPEQQRQVEQPQPRTNTSGGQPTRSRQSGGSNMQPR